MVLFCNITASRDQSESPKRRPKLPRYSNIVAEWLLLYNLYTV